MKIAVIGAGSGGQTVAAWIAIHGGVPWIYTSRAEAAQTINQQGIELFGIRPAQNISCKATTSLEEVVTDAEMIILTVPANAHDYFAQELSPFLQPDVFVVLTPGRILGSYNFARTLRNTGYKKKELPIIAETDTFIFTCRSEQIGQCNVFAEKENVILSTLYPTDAEKTIEKLSPYFPMMTIEPSMLTVGLSNIGMIFHPATTLFNFGSIDISTHFLFYKQGVTPHIADFLEKLDEERVAVAEKMGVEVRSAKEWLIDVYHSTGDTLYEALQNNYAYNQVMAPQSIHTRYISEDVPTGIVPVKELGEISGLDMQCCRLVEDVAHAMYRYDFAKEGRHFTKQDINNLKRIERGERL